MSTKATFSVKRLVLCALFCALTSVLSQITIPTPFGIPITLQTFAVALCGYFLGKRDGTISTLVYIAVGAVGVPVFAGFSGGIHKLAGPTGGFIFGFIFLALLAGAGMRAKNKAVAIAFGIIGVLACHALGIIQYSLVTGTGLVASFLVVSGWFLVKDAASAAIAYFLALEAKKHIK